jgi:hypothetical protein
MANLTLYVDARSHRLQAIVALAEVAERTSSRSKAPGRGNPCTSGAREGLHRHQSLGWPGSLLGGLIVHNPFQTPHELLWPWGAVQPLTAAYPIDPRAEPHARASHPRPYVSAYDGHVTGVRHAGHFRQ